MDEKKSNIKKPTRTRAAMKEDSKRKNNQESLYALMKKYDTEEKCRQYFEDCRWPGKVVVCPLCHSAKIGPHKGDYRCNGCGYEFSVRSKTFLESSHIPFSKWLMAIYILCNFKRGLDSISLSNILGVSQSNTWLLIQKISGMIDIEKWDKLKGTVEVDETYIGGKNKFRHVVDKIGKGKNANKTILLGMVERKGNVIFKIIDGRDEEDLMIALNYIEESATVYTDAWKPYDTVFKKYKDDDRYKTVVHSKRTKRTEEERRDSFDGQLLPKFFIKRQFADGPVWTNGAEGVFSRLKDMIGMHNIITAEHLERYANMFSFRQKYRNLSPYARMAELLKQMEDSSLSYDEAVSWAGKDAEERRELREIVGAPERGKLHVDFRKEIPIRRGIIKPPRIKEQLRIENLMLRTLRVIYSRIVRISTARVAYGSNKRNANHV